MLPKKRQRERSRSHAAFAERSCARCKSIFMPPASVNLRQAAAQLFCGRACSAKSRAKDPAQTLWDRSVPGGDGCWIWQGNKNPKGYGYMSDNGRLRTAHRVSYEKFCGPFPPHLQVLHRCDTPSCVNPDHLFLGSNIDNVQDRVAKGRSVGLAGERNPKAKLTAEDVVAIRRDPRATKTIAAAYGVSISMVGHIKRREFWRHVPEAA